MHLRSVPCNLIDVHICKCGQARNTEPIPLTERIGEEDEKDDDYHFIRNGFDTCRMFK